MTKSDIQGTPKANADGVSRRTVLGGAALVAGLGSTAMMSTQAMAKVAQKDVAYQDKPKGEAKCSTCAQFQAPNACQAVDGTISPEGWCQLYVKKG